MPLKKMHHIEEGLTRDALQKEWDDFNELSQAVACAYDSSMQDERLMDPNHSEKWMLDYVFDQEKRAAAEQKLSGWEEALLLKEALLGQTEAIAPPLWQGKKSL